MFIVDLECKNQHGFEGWYESAAEYASIRDGGDLTCPLCGSADVRQLLSTGSIRTQKTEAKKQRTAPVPQQGGAPQGGMPLEVQQTLARIVQQARATHEDVGEAFADRAIAMHRGEEEARPIRGEASADDEQRLDDEQVPYLKLPVPDIEIN